MFERAKTRIDATTTTVALGAAAAAVVGYLGTGGAPVGAEAEAMGTAAGDAVGLRDAMLVSLAVGAAVAAKWTVDVVRDLLDAAVKITAICALALVALHVGTGFDAVAFLDGHATRVWAAIEASRPAVDVSL